MRLKRFLLLSMAFLLIATTALTGCNNEKAENAVAKVNGEIISKTELEDYVSYQKKSAEMTQNIAPDMWDTDAGGGKTYEDQLREMALEELITQEILIQKAEEKGIEVTEEELNKEIEKLKGSEEDIKNFNDYLEKLGIKEEYFKSIYKKGMVISKLMDESIEISDNEAKEYYMRTRDKFDKVKARHILVKTEKEAKEIKGKLDNGEDFIELAKEKSTGPSAPNGGDLGYFTKGRMLPEFEETAFSLKEGEVSDPVKTQYGYHIIKVEDKKVSLEDNKEEVKDDLKNNKFTENVKKYREEAEVEKLIDLNKESKDKSEENKTENKKEDNKEE